jgi:hypothetical protein
MAALTSRNPMSLHGLYQGYLTLPFIGNGTRDIPAYSIGPQPIALPRAPQRVNTGSNVKVNFRDANIKRNEVEY